MEHYRIDPKTGAVIFPKNPEEPEKALQELKKEVEELKTQLSSLQLKYDQLLELLKGGTTE